MGSCVSYTHSSRAAEVSTTSRACPTTTALCPTFAPLEGQAVLVSNDNWHLYLVSLKVMVKNNGG